MGSIRKFVCLICALGLVGAGIFVLSFLFSAVGRQGLIVVAGSGLLGFGLYWLWVDFIRADPQQES
jgi:hypothetical protein